MTGEDLICLICLGLFALVAVIFSCMMITYEIKTWWRKKYGEKKKKIKGLIIHYRYKGSWDYKYY